MTEKSSTILPGTVEKIIKSPYSDEPEKAQISVEGADHLYREIRIDNTLTNENGDEVSLKRGAHVEVISSVTPLPLQQAVRTWPVPKELILAVTKVVAGIAAVVFILARFTTTRGVLLFAGSVVLFEP